MVVIIRNGKKHNPNKVSYNYLGSPNHAFKKITIQEDHNIHMYYLLCLVVLAVKHSRNSLLLVTYRNRVFSCFHFLTKEQRRKKNNKKGKFHKHIFRNSMKAYFC